MRFQLLLKLSPTTADEIVGREFDKEIAAQAAVQEYNRTSKLNGFEAVARYVEVD